MSASLFRPALAICLLTGLMLLPAAAYAQQAPAVPSNTDSGLAPKAAPAPAGSNADAPLEIEADKALVWNQKDKQYVAEGNAVATQGDMQVMADKLVADYREVGGRTEVWQLSATGNVRLASGKATGNGDKLVYDVGTGKALLTGQNLQLVGEDGSKVTATDHFEYWSNERKAVAVGNAVLTQKDTSLSSDTITAWLSASDTKQANAAKSASMASGIDKAEASGPVVIKTATETVTAKRGTYDGAKQIAYLYENVVLKRPPHHLEGARAEVNLATGISQLFAESAAGKPGRVRGVFFPGKNSQLKQ